MTARELLREVARAADLRAMAHNASVAGQNDAGRVLYAARAMVWERRAAALRALADRLDAEMASYEARADLNVKVCLSRLEADLNTTTPTRRAGT